MVGSLSFATVECFSSVFQLAVLVPVTAPTYKIAKICIC